MRERSKRKTADPKADVSFADLSSRNAEKGERIETSVTHTHFEETSTRILRHLPCDTLRVSRGNPDDSAPPARAVKVEVVHVEHRTPTRRVTGVGMTLTRPGTRRRRQDLTFTFAPAVLLLLDLLQR